MVSDKCHFSNLNSIRFVTEDGIMLSMQKQDTTYQACNLAWKTFLTKTFIKYQERLRIRPVTVPFGDGLEKKSSSMKNEKNIFV